MSNQEKEILYDAVLNFFSSISCNLNCQYCCFRQYINKSKTPSIDILATIRTLENTGKTFNIYFTGFGEPFLIPNFIKACKAITKKHYISLVTNLTSPLVQEFVNNINPKKVLFIKASAHIKELEKRDLFDVYFNNFSFLKEKGFYMRFNEVDAVAHPSLLGEVEKYKKLFLQKGVELRFEPFAGRCNGKKYPQAYTKEEIKIFNINPQIFYQYKKKCNAGYNIGVVLPDGEIKSCLYFEENIGSIYKEIKFTKKLIVCPFNKDCPCAPTISYPDLFNRALCEMASFGKN